MTRDSIVRAGALVALALILGCGEDVKSASDGSGDVKGGSAATDFTTQDADGNTFRLSDHLGKQVILIDFWATWCQPCLAEMPHLQRLYDDYKSQGFLVVAVSMDGPDTIADVPAFAKRNQMTFPVLLDEDSRIASIYNPRKSAPLSVIINRAGRVVAVREGYNPGDEVLVKQDVLKTLAASAAPPPAASAAPAGPPTAAN